MVQEVKTYDAKKISNVGKAFSHFLSLSNSAENHHRMRRLREFMLETRATAALSTKHDSALGTIRRLVSTHAMTADEVLAALSAQSVEIVLTGKLSNCNLSRAINFTNLKVSSNTVDLIRTLYL